MGILERFFQSGRMSNAILEGVLPRPKTLLTAQGYAVDWNRLEEKYPEIKDIPDFRDKWNHLTDTYLPDNFHWTFIQSCRTKIPGTYREIRDKVVTDDFVADVVDVLQNTTADVATFINYKYHQSGTGTAAEAAGDSDLGSSHGTRDSGTQTEGTAGNIYKSVATHTYTGSVAVTEHGLFNKSASGTLMDRTLFSVINVSSGNQIEFTFSITFSSGG